MGHRLSSNSSGRHKNLYPRNTSEENQMGRLLHPFSSGISSFHPLAFRFGYFLLILS